MTNKQKAAQYVADILSGKIDCAFTIEVELKDGTKLGPTLCNTYRETQEILARLGNEVRKISIIGNSNSDKQ